MTTSNAGVLKKLFRNRLFAAAIFFAEEKSKELIFGCQSCGQCVLSHTGFVCPMRCPKQMRNGPCGGYSNRHCEVNSEKLCAWIEIWEGTGQLKRTEELLDYEEPLDWRLYGTSSWENLVDASIGPFDSCGALTVWNVAAGEAERSLTAHSGPVTAVAFSPDGTKLASASLDQTVFIWDVGTWDIKAKLKGHRGSVNSVAFSVDGGLLASACDDGTVILWDTTEWVIDAVLRGHSGSVRSVARNGQ